MEVPPATAAGGPTAAAAAHPAEVAVAAFQAAAAVLAAAAPEEAGNIMKTFLSQLDHARIERAIADAEQKTSGELRVVIHHKPAPDPAATAKAQFEKLRMHRTRERNAVLLLVAPGIPHLRKDLRRHRNPRKGSR